MHDILVNNAQGLSGRFMNTLLKTVFPYVVLGSLFGTISGGPVVNVLSIGVDGLPGYDRAIHFGPLAWLGIRIVLALYLIASVQARYDRQPLSAPECGLRLCLAVLIVLREPTLHGAAFAVVTGLLFRHQHRNRKRPRSKNLQSRF